MRDAADVRQRKACQSRGKYEAQSSMHLNRKRTEVQAFFLKKLIPRLETETKGVPALQASVMPLPILNAI
jgi:hypothetical protein